jgi:hypothetical protein
MIWNGMVRLRLSRLFVAVSASTSEQESSAAPGSLLTWLAASPKNLARGGNPGGWRNV